MNGVISREDFTLYVHRTAKVGVSSLWDGRRIRPSSVSNFIHWLINICIRCDPQGACSSSLATQHGRMLTVGLAHVMEMGVELVDNMITVNRKGRGVL